MDKSSKAYRVSRGMYMGEATFEYLVALMVEGTFLARLTQSLGISDSLTGIISSFISLGCLFQLLSLLVRRRTVKRFVVIMSVANQALFTLLYVIPVTPLAKEIKTIVFVACLFLAYFLYYLAHPKKIGWMMSLVEDKTRGRFTANKEIVSLASGIAFTYGMGEVSDYFKAKGELNTAFLITAGVLLTLMALHTASLLCSIEPEHNEVQGRTGMVRDMAALLKDKNVRYIAVVFILWNMTTGCARFYGTLINGELEFSLLFASILSSVGSVVRMLFSRPLGRYADKHSFASLVRICLFAGVICFTCVGFVTKSNGKIIFTLYYIFHGIALAGINSSLINLIFDYVPRQRTADALAVCQSIAGVVGFLTSLLAGVLLDRIQKNGNTFFGLHIYAQQVLSIAAALFCVIGILFVSCTFLKKDRKAGKERVG